MSPDGAPERCTVEHLLGAVDLLCAFVVTGSWLRAIQDDPDALATVAARSYWHANGFAKLVLHVQGHLRLRMHIWPAGQERRGETKPHGHRWDFASTVLCGDGLAVTEYTEGVAASGQEYVRHVYDGATLVPRGPAHLRTTQLYAVARHTCYATGTGTVHTVDPLGSDLTATLVVQGPTRLDTAPVYVTPRAEPEAPPTAIDAADVRSLVGEVVDALGEGKVSSR